MKTIINNYDEISEEIINNEVKRAKLLIINSNNEIAVVLSHSNYFLVGGHVENKESDYECLDREIKEEMGITLPVKDAKKFYEIKYLNKDYPEKNINTLSLINYYYLKSDTKPNLDNLNLTEDERSGDFHIEYIKIDDIVDKLTKSLKNATKPGLVEDTIEVIKEYIKLEI